MPELNTTAVIILVVALLLGLIAGWLVRGQRTAGEKAAINAGWQERLEAQRTEHNRLTEQNKTLMEQNSQYQASNKDGKQRAAELAAALKEAFERRDDLQRQIKEIRGNLELAVRQRDQLQNQASKSNDAQALVSQRDEQVSKLRRELENWQERLPPLIEKYRQRNAEAEQLEADLRAAREKLAALEAIVGSDETRVEPVDPDALGDNLDASNEPIDEESESEPQDPNEADEPETISEFAEAEDDDDDFDAEDCDNDDFHAEDLEEPWAGNPAPDLPGKATRDDLKLIKGVGPAIEKTLNEMGILRFNQIAEMSEYDIDRVAQRLKGFRSRIYREDWMGQARELLTQKASG